jgi:hypothetical protein
MKFTGFSLKQSSLSFSEKIRKILIKKKNLKIKQI